MTGQITALYAGLLGLLLLLLSVRVSRKRMRYRVNFGDGGHSDLAQAIRVQGNFVEYVPITLLLILLIETSGFSDWVVHALGASLLLGRLGHAQGLTRSTGWTVGRFTGIVLTWLVLGAAALLCLAAVAGWRF